MDSEDAINMAFRDLLFNIIGVFAMLLMVVMININDPQNDKSADQPGQFIVTIVWPEGANDVDLWLGAPGQETPVFYKNKSGKIWNLLRDDLGMTNDLLPYNYENGYSRGTPEGEYTVNIFCYSCDNPVDVVVKIEQNKSGKIEDVAARSITLTGNGDWKTAFNFHVNKYGNVTRVNQVQKDLTK